MPAGMTQQEGVRYRRLTGYNLDDLITLVQARIPKLEIPNNATRDELAMLLLDSEFGGKWGTIKDAGGEYPGEDGRSDDESQEAAAETAESGSSRRGRQRQEATSS